MNTGNRVNTTKMQSSGEQTRAGTMLEYNESLKKPKKNRDQIKADRQVRSNEAQSNLKQNMEKTKPGNTSITHKQIAVEQGTQHKKQRASPSRGDARLDSLTCQCLGYLIKI